MCVMHVLTIHIPAQKNENSIIEPHAKFCIERKFFIAKITTLKFSPFCTGISKNYVLTFKLTLTSQLTKISTHLNLRLETPAPRGLSEGRRYVKQTINAHWIFRGDLPVMIVSSDIQCFLVKSAIWYSTDFTQSFSVSLTCH